MIHCTGYWYVREPYRRDVYVLCWAVEKETGDRLVQLVNIETGTPWRPGVPVRGKEIGRAELSQEEFDEVRGSGTFTKVDRSELV